MLRTRVVTAALGAPLLLLAIYAGGWLYAMAVGALALAATWEVLRLAGLAERIDLLGLGLGLLAAMSVALARGPGLVAGAIGVSTAAFAAIAMGRVLRFPGDSAETAPAWLGIAYVALAFAHFPVLRAMPDGLRLTLTVFVLTWTFDTAAYFIGLRFGRSKLAPRLSPGKSWEGAGAGTLAALCLASLPLPIFAEIAPLRLAIGLTVVVFGQLGDLFESSLKRAARVKDSGGILPGHGGILDRFDSLMFAVPAAYYLLRLLPSALGVAR